MIPQVIEKYCIQCGKFIGAIRDSYPDKNDYQPTCTKCKEINMQSAKFIETAIIIDGSNYQDLLDKGNIPHDADETGKGCYARILLVPKSDDYFKTLIACCVDLLTRLLRENLKAETPFLSKVQMLGRFIGYFFNCDSYEKQEFQDYDVRELKARIRKVL